MLALTMFASPPGRLDPAQWHLPDRPMASADFGKLRADETEKWGKLTRVANIKAG
jgi:hypothetical protein